MEEARRRWDGVAWGVAMAIAAGGGGGGGGSGGGVAPAALLGAVLLMDDGGSDVGGSGVADTVAGVAAADAGVALDAVGSGVSLSLKLLPSRPFTAAVAATTFAVGQHSRSTLHHRVIVGSLAPLGCASLALGRIAPSSA